MLDAGTLVKQLGEAGMSQAQAEILAAAIAQASETNAVTREEFNEALLGLQEKHQTDVDMLKTELASVSNSINVNSNAFPAK